MAALTLESDGSYSGMKSHASVRRYRFGVWSFRQSVTGSRLITAPIGYRSVRRSPSCNAGLFAPTPRATGRVPER